MANIYESVTERIVSTLESGVIPWRKDWKCASGLPVNYVTGKPYRGINVLTLLCAEASSNRWMTYKQAQAAGLQVRKGQHGQPIIFWKFDRRQDSKTGEEYNVAFARGYTVFNVDQVDGITDSLPFDAPQFEPIAAAEQVTAQYLASANAPTLEHGGAKAFYAPLRDRVQMPVRESFSTAQGYYSTLFHEFAHSTGHHSRLRRFTSSESHAFGSESYSKEELVAEFAAAFLCAETSITNDALHANHAAYIQGWLKALKNDRTLAISAAQRAQKAADFILLRADSSSEAVSA